MIQDLIDLYYYIRSTDDIMDLTGWSFNKGEVGHYVTPDIVWNPTDLEMDWRIKVSVGTVDGYRRIFLHKKRVEILDSTKYSYSVSIPQIINEFASDMLMNYISTDEIAIMNQIYVEMRKLLNRSPRGRINP